MNRRVLMIAYYFPPSLEVGRMRTVKFCKFLPEFGWMPVVVAPCPGAGEDPTLLSEIPPATEVHRAGRGALLKRVLATGRRVRDVLRAARRHAGAAPSPDAAQSRERSGRSWASYLCWPDLEASWIRPAARQAIALASGCDALYSSGWPMSCHVAALRVARRTRLPWALDFRDPWVDQSYPLGFQRRLYQRLQRECVAAATWVINVNEQWTEQHRAANPGQPPEKFVTIHNGVDPDDFRSLPQAPAGPPLRLTYVGNLYGGRSALPLVEAAGRLKSQGSLTGQDLHITLMGIGTDQLADRVAALQVQDWFTLLPRRPYHEALAAVSSSHMALLLFGDVDSTASPSATKVYEACYLRKPALAVLACTPLWETIEAAGAVCSPPDDVRALAERLLALARGFRESGRLPRALDVPEAATGTRRAQTEHLASLLDKAAAERRAKTDA